VSDDEILVEGRVEECPVCGDSFASVGRHMAQVHPDEWAEFERRRVWIRTKDGEATFEEVER
jgi:hypothetical protein